MKFLRNILVLLSVVLLSSCVAVSTANIEELDKLAANEAVIIAKTKGSNIELVGKLYVHDKEVTGLGLPLGSLSVKSSEQLLMIKVDAGQNIYLSGFVSYGGKANFGKEDFNFSLEPGTITYIGDISIIETYGRVNISVSDNEEETVAMARKASPWLFSKYPYKKHIVIRK